jgi:hypothetical protein
MSLQWSFFVVYQDALLILRSKICVRIAIGKIDLTLPSLEFVTERESVVIL